MQKSFCSTFKMSSTRKKSGHVIKFCIICMLMIDPADLAQ